MEVSPSSVGSLPGVIAILFSFIPLFFGLKFFKCILFVNGFIIGSVIGGVFGAIATKDGGITLVLFLVLGIVGGYVAMALRRVAYFIFGAILGVSAAASLCVIVLSSSSGVDINVFGGLLVTGGLVGGIVACYIGDLIVILCTAALGAFGATCGSLGLFNMDVSNGGLKFLLLLELAGWLAAGIWFQLSKREQWKHVLEFNNTTVVNTEVNTNVSNSNTIQVLIQQPTPQQIPMQQMSPYPQYGQPQQYSQPQQYGQPQYGQPQQHPSQYPTQQGDQPQQEYAKPQAV